MALLRDDEALLWVPQAVGNEALVSGAISRAAALAERYCKRPLESASRTEYHSIEFRQHAVRLLAIPIVSITSVTEDAQSDSPTAVSASDYVVDSVEGILYRETSAAITGSGSTPAYWTEGKEALKVVYTGGYTNTTLPDGLRHTLLQLVGWVISTRGNVGVMSETVEGVAQSYRALVEGIPEDIATALDAYAWKGVG